MDEESRPRLRGLEVLSAEERRELAMIMWDLQAQEEPEDDGATGRAPRWWDADE